MNTPAIMYAVSIRWCPPFISCIGDKPGYWYLKRPLFTMDANEIGWTREQIKSFKDSGYEVAYWIGEEWAIMSPKQFATAEEAYTEWKTKVADGAKNKTAAR